MSTTGRAWRSTKGVLCPKPPNVKNSGIVIRCFRGRDSRRSRFSVRQLFRAPIHRPHKKSNRAFRFLGQAIGAAFSGLVFDLTGSYHFAFIMLAVFGNAAIGLILLTKPPLARVKAQAL